MIWAIICYFLTFCLTIVILNKRRIQYVSYPKLYLKKFGLVFYSFKTHRINIKDCKTMQVDKIVYIKKDSKMIILTNVDNLQFNDDYMYFSGLGKVKISFNCTCFYKYFNIDIDSKKLDLKNLKQLALLDVINNLFNLKNAKILLKYLKVITKVLNISINDKKIIVKRNKFKIPYILTYKVNNVLKRVNVNETF